MFSEIKDTTRRLFIQPPWLSIVILVGVVLPVIVALASAFIDENRFSLDHIVRVASDASRLWSLAANSLKVAGISVLVSIGIGIPLGFALFRVDLPFKTLWKMILLATCCLPSYAIVTCWMSLFDIQTWSSAIWAAGLIGGVSCIPFVSLICGLSFCYVNSDLEDDALINTSSFKTFYHVTLREARCGIVIAILAVVILNISDITITDIVMVRTFTEEVFAEFQLNRTHGPAAAVALPILGIMYVLGILLFYVTNNSTLISEQTDITKRKDYKLNQWKYVIFIFVVCVNILILAPFVSLLGQIDSIESIVRTVRDVKLELYYSYILGGIAAVCTSILSWPIALLFVRRRRYRLVVLGWIIMLMTTPAPLVGIGLARICNREGILGMIYDSPYIVVIAFIIRFLPYNVLFLAAGIHKIPASLEEEASLSGASQWEIIRYLFLPLNLKSIALGAVLVLILSLGEIGASILIVPPGQTTLTIHFFTLIHYGVYSDASVICLLLTASVVIPSMILGYYYMKMEHR